jgi:hypothetical protein
MYIALLHLFFFVFNHVRDLYACINVYMYVFNMIKKKEKERKKERRYNE